MSNSVDNWQQQTTRLQEFLAWLPEGVADVPGIDWQDLPPGVREYCVRTVESASPSTPHLVLAVAAACGAISANSLLQLLRNLHALLNTLRTVCAMQRIADLSREELWHEFASRTQPTRTRSQQLSAYSAASGKHFPRYLARLRPKDAAWMERYRLPLLPDHFLRDEGRAYELNNRSRRQQQVIRETLLPLVPALCELVTLRRSVMAQILGAFHRAQRQVELGASLPLAFELHVAYPTLVLEDGEWELQQQDRTLCFWLWNRRSWVLGHQERYSQTLIKKVKKAQRPYTLTQEQYFVEFEGQATDLLWYGDLIEHRLLQHLTTAHEDDPTFVMRQELAQSLGCSYGCSTSIGGLLQPESGWLAVHARAGDLLFEPEALFRGSLYGAALVLLALISGGTTGELLHISADRWFHDTEGTFQRLIPERAQDGEELLLQISPQALHLLQEIEQGLVKAHAEVPVVAVSRQVARFDLLQPERYLFQWKGHMLNRRDTEVLVLFLMHGVTVQSDDGTPIPLTLDHLCLGGNVPLEERARVLKKRWGFNQTILPHLSPQSLDSYCRALYAYFDYAAGSLEEALRPLTLARWMVHMLDQEYERETVNRHLSIVQHLFREAEIQGFVDRDGATALQSVEEIPAQGEPASNARDDSKPHLWFSSIFKKCGKLNCSVCREGQKQGHGPYWYGFWREDGQQHSFYIGRAKNPRTIAAALKKKQEQLQEQRAVPPIHTGYTTHMPALVPLGPVLSQFIIRRVHLSEAVQAAIREAEKQQTSMGASLPFRFQFAATIPELDVESSTLRERAVVFLCSLWDKQSWVARHTERYGEATTGLARRGVAAYSKERNTHFVQVHSYRHNVLWFGDLLEHTLLRILEPEKDTTYESVRRSQRARDLGFPRGCHTSRAGLLSTGDRWFAENARDGELLFEPESLFRGIRYGAALALLSLEGGLGSGELLQVSARQWVEGAADVSKDEPGGHSPTVPIFLQSLVPDGATTGEERRLYPVSLEAKHLLDGIARELEEVHGEIPSVPTRYHSERLSILQPEPFLFQWQTQMIIPQDIALLIRFVLYGVKNPQGERMDISTEILRKSSTLAAVQHDRDLESLRDILLVPLTPGLTPSSLKTYQQEILAYLRYAGSREQAFQPETLRRWIAHLSNPSDHAGRTPRLHSINRKVTPVRRAMAEAGRSGQLDQARASAFAGIRVRQEKKRGPKPRM